MAADLFAWIEALAPVVALKRSFLAYPLVNAAHILSIGVLVTTVILMDLRILGGLSAIDGRTFIALMRRLALFAFAGAVLTGASLFSVRAGDYAANPAFLLKMALIPVAVLNMFLFRHLARGWEAATWRHDPPRFVRGTAAMSLLLWLAVLLCGRFIAFL